MINQAGMDLLDDAIDSFEENWSPGSPRDIRSLLERFDLADDSAALTELIRIDIELRYKQGLPTRLKDYFEEFEDLLAQPQHVAQIAFEDFRSRSFSGHPLSTARWKDLPGVGDEVWYQRIAQQDRLPTPEASARPQLVIKVDPDLMASDSVESALESIGFQLIQQVGQGAFSRVYLATQNDLANRYVVLKVVEQTLAEPQNMAVLQHTNIVPIYSFHRIPTGSVICMPYTGVVTLADFLAGHGDASKRVGQSLVTTVVNRVNGTLITTPEAESESGEGPPKSVQDEFKSESFSEGIARPLAHLSELNCNELAVWVFGRLADALAHSHARGVLHGDLKPANVLIRNDGEPSLLDFNLSQSLDRSEIKHIGGTLPYMSPESLRGLMGQVVHPHATSDIYSLGVMLFEFVTGRLPFPTPHSSAPTDLESAIQARRASPSWLSDDAVTPGLKSIIDRTLAFEPETRYASAEQLHEDLEREDANLPLLVAKESPRSRVRKWVRRHPQMVSGTTVGLLLAALLIPVAIAAKVSRDQSQHMTVLANVNSFAGRSDDALARSAASPTRLSEDQVVAAMQPLEEFGILDASRQAEFESPLMTQAESSKHRETALRHTLHVAFAELGRLRTNQVPPVAPEKLGRVDRLIETAVRLQGDTPSRGCLYAQAERAELAGDPSWSELKEKAGQLDLESDSEKYLEAIRLMARRKYQKARELLTELNDRETIPSALHWTSLGRSQFYAEDFDQAILSFTRSLEYAPESSRLWYLRARCYYKQGRYKLALKDFTQAIKYESTLTYAYTTRGLCHRALGDHEEAIKDFDTALSHTPGNVHALILRSGAKRKIGDERGADRDWQKALAASDLTYTELIARSNERVARKDLPGAYEDLQLAKQKDRADPAVLANMASVLAPMDRIPEAIGALDQYLEMRSSDNARINRAVLLARVGRDDEAINDLKKSIQNLPNPPREQYQAACVNALLLPRNKGNRQRALFFLSQSLQKDYGADAIATDSDLDSLRGDADFQALLRTAELGTPKTARNKIVDQSSFSPKPAP